MNLYSFKYKIINEIDSMGVKNPIPTKTMQKSTLSQEMDDKKITTFSNFIEYKMLKKVSGVQIKKNGAARN